MATRGDTEERTEGQHDKVELSPAENAAFDQLAASAQDSNNGYTRRYGSSPSAGGGFYRPSGQSVYDDQRGGGHDGYTRRMGPGNDGYTRRDGRSKRDLRNAEEGASGPSRAKKLAANGLSGLLDSEKQGAGGGDSPFSYNPSGARFGKTRSFLKRHRKTAVAGSLAGIGIIPMLALLIFLLGALKIPHFVENVVAWRFAKVTRQYRLSSQNVMGEKNAMDTLEDGDFNEAKAKYGKYKIFDKVNRLRPNRVVQSLKTNDRIQYNYKETLTGRKKLVSITFATEEDLGKKVTVKVPGSRFGISDKILHPIRTMDQYKAIQEAASAAIHAHDSKVPVMTRTAATVKVLRDAGASLKGMAASKYLGSNNQAAELNKIYSDLVANTNKYNALVQQYSELVQKYDEIYKQHTEVYKEWQPLYKEYQAALKQWQIAFDVIDKGTGVPTPDLTRQVAEAAEKLDSVTEKFNAKNAELKDFLTELKSIRTQMDGIKAELHALYSERVALTERYGANGGTLSDRDAKIAIEQETYEKAHRTGINGIAQEHTRKIAQDAADAEDAAVKDKAQMGDLVDKGLDVPDSVNNVIEKGLNAGTLSKMADTVVGAINPIYDIAVPVCMAYDGSKITPEGVDAQHDSRVSEAAYVLSTGDQQRNGQDFTTVMAGAMNWKLGNIQESNAIRRISAKPVDTTANPTSGQRTAMGTYGEYTIFDVLHMGSMNGWADDTCPKLTNFWVGLGIGVGNLVITGVLSFFTAGGAGAAEISAAQGARVAAEEGLKEAVTRIATQATKKAIKSLATSGRFFKQFGKDTVKYGAAAAAATFLATVIVNHAAGLDSSGLEKDVAFADNVDDGAEQLSGDVGRANFYARPLNNAEIVQSHVADQAEIAYNLQHQSTFERYLALDNPNSLASRMAITTGSMLDRSMFASLLNSLATLFNPIGLSSKLFAGINSTATLAAGNEDTADYGNVIWGYSAKEQQLMQQDTYSSPSENEFVLETSGKEQKISEKYSKCYNNTIGKLLANKDIQRSDQPGQAGNVKDEGDCSPKNLGPDNPDFGDLVFRWRLKHNYENTADTLLGIQDPETSSATAGGSGNIPSGTAQELATKILANQNITFQLDSGRTAMQHIAETGRAVNCSAPDVSPILLGVILAASTKYKLVLGVLTDGHECDGGFHPKGMAIDVNGVNPLGGGEGGTGNYINKGNYETNTLLKEAYGNFGDLLGEAGGGGLGQIECFSSSNIPNKNSKVTYFTGDSCDHLHVDVGHR